MKVKLLLILFLLITGIIFSQDQDVLDRAQSVSSKQDLEQLKKMTETRDSINSNLYMGIAYHNLSQSDPDFVDQSIELLEESWKENELPLALAYLGSAVTIRAGIAAESGDLLAAMADLSAGIKKIDKAVILDPDSLNIRVLRIVNSISLSKSSPVSREKEIEEDLDCLFVQLAELDNETQSLYWFYTGDFALTQNRWDDAFFALEKAIQTAPLSSYAQTAEQLLWELEE